MNPEELVNNPEDDQVSSQSGLDSDAHRNTEINGNDQQDDAAISTDVESPDRILCTKTLSFRATLKKAVEDAVNYVTEEKFTELYKSFFENFEKMEGVDQLSLRGSSKEAAKVRQKMNNYVVTECLKDVDEMIETHDLNQKFLALQNLIDEANEIGSSKEWRPPGNAEEHMVPFSYSALIGKRKRLMELVKDDEEDLRSLDADIMENRKRIEKFHTEVTSCNQKIKGMLTKSKKED